MPETQGYEAPTTRKYEQGTALDHNRIFRAYDETVTEIDSGARVLELQSMLRNDPQARQLATALKLPIRKAKWDIVAHEGDDGEKDFVEWALTASAREGGMTTPMREVLAKMANAIVYRFSAFEKVWHLVESGPYKGKVSLHKLGYRPTSTCQIRADKNGSFNGFIQKAYKGNKYREIPYTTKNSLVYINGADEMPLIGMTPFDTVWKMYNIKMKVSFFYFAFLENVAFPRTLAKVLNDDPEQMEALLNKARKLSSMGIVGLYEEESLEPYESNRSTRDYQTALEYIDWQMAKACLGQFLDLGTSGERGSFALSQDKTAFFFESLEAILEDIASTINNYLIPDLVQYNFGRDAAFPHLKFRPLNDKKGEAVLDIFKNVLISPAPNVTPPFLLGLMKRVEELTDLEIDPLSEYDPEELELIMQTIPTAREHLMSKESRAGAGQNPVTGEDRNADNLTPQDQEQAATVQGDGVDIVAQGPPHAPDTKGRRKRKKKDEE